jgi:peptidylprolyl isomerase
LKKLITAATAIALLFSVSACADSTTPTPEESAMSQDSSLSQATGMAQPAEPGFPTISLAANGAPEITQLDEPAPADFKLSTTIKGEGQVVTLSDLVTVHYSGWVWGGDLFDSSWTRGEPAQFSLLQVIPGFTKALEGQTVGSQVIAVIPPAEGYGDQGAGSIPPNSTLIFVVDILAATPLPQ